MLRKFLPHAAIIISMMYFVFFFIVRVKSVMAFIDNDITKVLLFALGLISIWNALTLIREDRARERRRQQLLKQRRAQQAGTRAAKR